MMRHKTYTMAELCRSPHGERGLKSEDALLTAFDGEVALLMESVD